MSHLNPVFSSRLHSNLIYSMRRKVSFVFIWLLSLQRRLFLLSNYNMICFKFLFSTCGFSKNCFVHKLCRHMLTACDSGSIAATPVSFLGVGGGGVEIIVCWRLMWLVGDVLLGRWHRRGVRCSLNKSPHE